VWKRFKATMRDVENDEGHEDENECECESESEFKAE
jgi:hypothetical protein